MIKILIKYTVYGIGIGCVILMACIIMLDLFWPDAFYTLMQNFAVNILSGLAISTVAYAGAVAYELDRLSFGLQVVLHTAVVLTVALLVAFMFGWFSSGRPIVIAIGFAAWLAVFFAVWLGFYLFGNRELKKINDKIRERDSQS